MAVIAQIVVESRRYSGWIDPRYPIGFWQASLSVTGDASGGLLAIDLVFQGAVPAALNSQMYSVERIGATQDTSTGRIYRVGAVNMGGPANTGFRHEYTVPMVGHSGGGAAALSGDTFTFIPWFLGSQRTPGITASLSLVGLNSNNVTVTFEAEGYRWSPRSVLIDGGPQRPPTGLYRA